MGPDPLHRKQKISYSRPLLQENYSHDEADISCFDVRFSRSVPGNSFRDVTILAVNNALQKSTTTYQAAQS